MEIYWTKCNQCFIQTWKQWWEMKTVGETAAWARSAENWARRPKVGMTFLAGKQSSPSPPAAGIGSAVSIPSGLRGVASTAQMFSTAIFSIHDDVHWHCGSQKFISRSILSQLLFIWWCCDVLVYDAKITVGKSNMIVRILGKRRFRWGTRHFGGMAEEMTIFK